MIVKNEAHVIRETLDSIAPYISSWVIVDTGSDDGTQELIRHHMAHLKIPGVLHERPWRNFGHNRTEAMALAEGHGDYIWVHDADDPLLGAPDFSLLIANAYKLRYRLPGDIFCWRTQLFRNGMNWRWKGAIHERPIVEHDHLTERIDGEYYIDYRQTGSRSRDPQKYARDAELLLSEIESSPDDIELLVALVACYTNSHDYANVRSWAPRAIKVSRSVDMHDGRIYPLLLQLANSMECLGEPWPNIEKVYLAAWKSCPARAEPLYVIAQHHRANGNYRVGYIFAKHAAEMPLPADDTIVVRSVYTWQAIDEQAACASGLGKYAEAFALYRKLIAIAEIPEPQRQQISARRDSLVQAMIEVAAPYPATVVADLTARKPETDIAVSLAVGPDCGGVEHTLNSFLHCCLDADRIGRFVIFHSDPPADDHDRLRRKYPFLEFVTCTDITDPAQLRGHITSRFWLHLHPGWQFFAPDNFITRLSGVLAAEPGIAQVAINYAGAARLTGSCAPEETVRRTPQAGRYTLTDEPVDGPIMYDTTRINRTGQHDATLDEIVCIQPGSTRMRLLVEPWAAVAG